MGNAMGMIGVIGGVITALAQLQLPAPVFTQALALIGVASAIGSTIGFRVPITELPQTVAAFHALVGIAAVTTSLASFMIHPSGDGLHRAAAYLGSGVGAITFTGSIIAYLALSGKLRKGYDLPMKEIINKPLYAANILGFAAMMGSSSYGVGLASLLNTTFASAALGWNITKSIGSADMPVAITVLNSYSGWALCAEGFMLNNAMLTIVGSLIGSSGAILSYIMCKAMNRTLSNVIFGQYGSVT